MRKIKVTALPDEQCWLYEEWFQDGVRRFKLDTASMVAEVAKRLHAVQSYHAAEFTFEVDPELVA